MCVTVEKYLQAWINSLKQMKAQSDIVFLGDSLTYYGDFASVFPNKVVCNLGLRGDTIQGIIDRMELVSVLEPKQVFLMIGINDVATCSMEKFKELYGQLMDVVIEQNPSIELIIQSVLPVNNADYTISCNNVQIKSCNSVIKGCYGSRYHKRRYSFILKRIFEMVFNFE